MSTGTPITDPVELAWCEFARRYSAYREIPSGEQGLSIASFGAGVTWAREQASERERELEKGLAALLQDAVRYERLPPDQPSIVNARDLLKKE